MKNSTPLRFTTSRRTFVSLAAASAATWWLREPAFGAPRKGDPILVILRLGGGNDGLNTVIPMRDDRYHSARPGLRITPESALPFTDDLAFHPSLAGLRDLADSGRLAVVSNVGYPDPDRSHFRSLDIWHSGSLAETARRGFLAPLVDREPPPGGDEGAIAVVDDRLPLALVGDRRAAPVIFSLDDFGAIDRSSCIAATPTDPTPALRHLTAAHAAALSLDERLARLDRGRTRGLPGSKLGRALTTVLDLLEAGVRPRVFYVAHDGFDTHTRQADAHAALLRDFGDCLRAFDAALPDAIDPRSVLVYAFSEFGRRVAENASLGTDHGTAGPVFLASRAIAPGLHGSAPNLANLEDGDLRFEIDFRRVLVTLVDRWLGLDARACLGEEARHFEPLPFLSRMV